MDQIEIGRYLQCRFCKNGSRSVYYIDNRFLSQFINTSGRIRSRRATGLCYFHQKKLAREVKRARHLAILPHTESNSG